MRILILFITVIIPLSTLLPGCKTKHGNRYIDSPGIIEPYMGQKVPGAIPELFAPGIISTDAFEFAITFSSDGKDIYFTRRATYEGGGNSIMHSFYNEKDWSKPGLAPFSDSEYVELAPFCAPDEDRIYFHSDREHPETGKRMVNDEKIWYSLKMDGKWSEPEFLKGELNSGWVMGIAAANSGTLYLCGEVNGLDGLLVSAYINGSYPRVEKCFEGVHPYVSPDEDYIIYDVILENWEETALCIRFKKEDGEWDREIRLPTEINSTGTESFGRVSPDGNYLFFQRNGDIYWADFKMILKGI